MQLLKIKDFSEIDFVKADPIRDQYQLPGGEIYRFSDEMCDNCGTGGTVLETGKGKKRFFCVMCRNYLRPVVFTNDFLPPTGDEFRFFLPVDWTEPLKQEWYNEYKERRIAQEKIREDILKFGKE